MTQQIYMTDEVRVGKKGQVTIPRKMRDADKLKEADTLKVTYMPGGDFIFRKKVTHDPVDKALEILRTVPDFDWRKAWKEVVEERRRERA